MVLLEVFLYLRGLLSDDAVKVMRYSNFIFRKVLEVTGDERPKHDTYVMNNRLNTFYVSDRV